MQIAASRCRSTSYNVGYVGGGTTAIRGPELEISLEL